MPELGRFLGALILAGSLAAGWFLMDIQGFMARTLPLPEEGMAYTVAPGTTLKGLARDLHDRGVLEKPLYFVLAGRFQGKAGRLKAGEYLFLPGTTPQALLDQIAAGKVVRHRFTLVEGWTFHQVRKALEAKPQLAHTLAGLDDAAVMARLGHPGEHPEGRFFPETYLFQKGAADVDILKQAYALMEKRLAEAWEKRAPDLPYRDPYEALILASIVEKEAALDEERPLIAGVFVRRLKLGIPLQADPTVIYGLGEGFKGPLTRRHLRVDTPYNTYLHRGLPPTPIAMPGEASLQAALHPAAGDALYFVAKGDGSHKFSATLAEHNKAVRAYR